MTRALPRAAALVVGLLVSVLLATALSPSSGAAVAGSTSATADARRHATVQRQHVKVNWKGNWKKRVYTKTATIPGIGSLDLRCTPDDTEIRLYTSDRGDETQMWLQKYEVKNGKDVVAVKNVRIYRYQNASDDGKGGTGSYAHEGLNQQPGIENRSQDGYLYGVISQRPGRNRSGDAFSQLRPVTTFEMTWNWNGFDYDLPYRSCTIDAKFTTQLVGRSGITWHGFADDAPTVQSQTIPGIGRLTLTCSHDRSVAPTLSIKPTSASSSLFVQDVAGEGQVQYQREQTTLQYDDDTGLLGPYPLPTNGSLRLKATNGSTSHWLMVSSFWKTNDPRPERNLCEVSSGWYDR